jgi:hypothetical protein
MNIQIDIGGIVMAIILIIGLSFIGINMIFRNEASVNWFEKTATNFNRHSGKMTGHKFNIFMFYVMGVISLLLSAFTLVLIALAIFQQQ